MTTCGSHTDAFELALAATVRLLWIKKAGIAVVCACAHSSGQATRATTARTLRVARPSWDRSIRSYTRNEI